MPAIPGIPKPELVGDELLRQVEIIRGYDSKYDDYKMAAALGLPVEIYQGRMAWAKSQHTKDLKPWDLGAPLSITGDSILIGDVHAPLCDYTFASLINTVAKKHLKKPRRLIIGGDLFDMDIWSFWAKIVSTPSWKEEKHAVTKLMQEWSSVFDEIVLITGNHELRAARATDAEFDIHDLADLVSVNVKKLTASLFGYCFLTSGAEKWVILHPSEYSAVNQAGILNEYAQKYQMHVVGFHAHTLNLSWDKWNRFLLVNGGCLASQESMGYKHLVANKKPDWNLGFTMIRDGSPYLYGRSPMTCWEKWL